MELDWTVGAGQSDDYAESQPLKQEDCCYQKVWKQYKQLLTLNNFVINTSSVMLLHRHCLVMGGKEEALLISLLKPFITVLVNILTGKYLGLCIQGNSVPGSLQDVHKNWHQRL